MVRVRKSTVASTKATKNIVDLSFKSPKRKDGKMSKGCRGKLSHASPPRISTRSYLAKFLQTPLVENQNPQLDCRPWQGLPTKIIKEDVAECGPKRIDAIATQVSCVGRTSPRKCKRENDSISPLQPATLLPPVSPSRPVEAPAAARITTESRVNADIESKSNKDESDLSELKAKTVAEDSDPSPLNVPQTDDTLHTDTLATDNVSNILDPDVVPNYIQEVLVTSCDENVTAPSPKSHAKTLSIAAESKAAIASDVKSPDCVISPIPHKIQLCSNDLPPGPVPLLMQSPSCAMSHLRISPVVTTAKKTPKSRRRLNPSQSANQQEVPKRSYVTKKDIALTNHKVTEYFPIRRSIRKTKQTVLEEKQMMLEEAVKMECEDGLEVRNFEGKGRGIVATREFAKGDFVVEYCGELIDMGEAKSREQIYTQDQNTGCYMYYFKYKNNQYCIDATKESGRLGRLVNHSRNGNLMTKTISIGCRPHLVLLAKETIGEGQEVLYDYGDRSKESLINHPWLNL